MTHFTARFRLIVLAAFTCLAPALTGSGTGTATAQSHSAVTPAARTGRVFERFQTLNERVKQHQGDLDIVFIGDSITQGWEGAGKSVWEKYYGDRRVLNLGIGGDRTQHVLWRLDHGNADGIHPAVTVLMIGTNNSADDRNSAAEMVDGIKAVVAKVQSKFPDTRLLLLGIFPRGENFNPQRGKILQVNQTVRKLADAEWIGYLDIGHHFLESDGSISREVMPDFLHLTERGYEIWASQIEPHVVAMLKAAANSRSRTNPAGDWTWTMPVPQDRMVDAELHLTTDHDRLTGHFVMNEDRRLAIEEGSWDESGFRFVVRRNRPDGGLMIYRMSGNVADNKLIGTVKTELNGEAIEREWTAKRIDSGR